MNALARTPTIPQQRREFAVLMVQVKDRAGRLGLWRTMHKLDEATKAVGYEIADIELGKQSDLSEAS